MMKTLRQILILGVMISLVPTVSLAQPDPSRKRNEDACGGDARRMCRKVLDQGDMVILDCLLTNQKKLSAACRKVLRDNGQL
jgi:hypothetical protein